jgi:DNA-directed RNA polymerase beta subunit
VPAREPDFRRAALRHVPPGEDKNVKEERVYMGELPLMAPQGTFIINGAERVVVSQLHRSPGICFESSLHANGKELYSFRIIPDRGSWLEVMFDTSDLLYVHLDRRKRRRKFLATTFLRALGYSSDEEIIKLFYTIEGPQAEARPRRREAIGTKVLIAEIRDSAKADVVVARAFEPLTKAVIRRSLELGIKKIKVVDTKDDGIDHQVPQEGPGQERGRGAQGHLPPPAPWRSADRHERQGAAQAFVLRPEALRPRPRRPLQDQPEARHQG